MPQGIHRRYGTGRKEKGVETRGRKEVTVLWRKKFEDIIRLILNLFLSISSIIMLRNVEINFGLSSYETKSAT